MEPQNGALPKGVDMSMQIPLVCPGRRVDGQSAGEPCGSNVFEMVTVAMYTRHRLKPNDRRFDAPVSVGSRFRCIGCGHVLDKTDFNSPMSGTLLKPV